MYKNFIHKNAHLFASFIVLIVAIGGVVANIYLLNIKHTFIYSMIALAPLMLAILKINTIRRGLDNA